jgi:hypothetical protein
MDKEEIVKLRAHLRRSLGAAGLNVVPDSRNKESAAVQLGERKIGTLLADEEDGDLSFFFEMNVPVERPALQDYLRKLFENDKLTIETKRQPSPDTRALAREYEEFDFARSFRIPAGIDAPKVSAEVKNGTLTVHLPKSEAVRPRRVEVRGN